jgi:hypothetical protein
MTASRTLIASYATANRPTGLTDSHTNMTKIALTPLGIYGRSVIKKFPPIVNSPTFGYLTRKRIQS